MKLEQSLCFEKKQWEAKQKWNKVVFLFCWLVYFCLLVDSPLFLQSFCHSYFFYTAYIVISSHILDNTTKYSICSVYTTCV